MGKLWWIEHVKEQYLFPIHLNSVERNHEVKTMWNSSCYLSSMTCEPHTKLGDTIFPQASLLPHTLLWLSPIYSNMQEWPGCFNSLSHDNHCKLKSCPLKPYIQLIIQHIFNIIINLHIFPFKTGVTWFDHLQSFPYYSLPEIFLLA